MEKITHEEQYMRYTTMYIPDKLSKILLEDNKTRVLALKMLSGNYQTVAALEWHLHKDSLKFKEYIKESINYSLQYNIDIITRKPETRTNTTDLGTMFDSMSTGDYEFMKGYLEYIDDNYEYEVKATKHPADWLYRCLIVIGTGRYEKEFGEFMDRLKQGYATKKWQKLNPYELLIEAIHEKDEKKFVENIAIVADKHKRLSRGTFDSYADELICMRGLGLCNLAVMKGMRIEFDHPFIPKELIG